MGARRCGEPDRCLDRGPVGKRPPPAPVTGQRVPGGGAVQPRQRRGGGRWVRAVVGFLFGLGVDMVLGAALLPAVPRVKVRWRRLLWSALLIAVGLEALNLGGQFYIVRPTANPAYQVVASAVGLLIF